MKKKSIDIQHSCWNRCGFVKRPKIQQGEITS
ncbi:MAG: hypothetical protein A4E60_02602 [Syntrophorhabdus sp. PtaB.Bin047]|nr:MAG: hypothetical protein A4E60_02602 [Syntrophorhabdus sp. PtaB.Bin047]